MICLMHEGSVYGYLKVGNKVILPNNLARMVGATLHEVEGWLHELEDAAVYSKDEHGCIFSRRMIRDEEIRESRAAGGIKGGNPTLLDGKVRLTSKDNQKPTPSSSSSSASSPASAFSKATPSKSKAIAPLALLAALGVPEQIAIDWLKVRKAKRAPLTETALADLQVEANKAGISVVEAITICARKNWQGFNSTWNWNDNPNHGKSQGVQEARLSVAEQITGGKNGTQRPVKDVTPGRTIEGDAARIPETLAGLREPDAG